MRDDQAIDSDPICGESAKGADLISPVRRLWPSTSATKIAASFRPTERGSNLGTYPVEYSPNGR